MCYAKPGPRCTPHARAALVEAHRAFREDPSDENFSKWQSASKTYDSTKGGQKEIRAVLDRLPPASECSTVQLLERDLHEVRLTNGQEERAQAMAAYRASRPDEALSGEVDHNGVEATYADPTYAEPESRNLSYSGIEMEYDSYGCSGCFDDICRDSTYEGLRVESVDMQEVLAATFKCRKNKLDEAVIEKGYELGLDDKDSYDIETYGGYYGDEYSVTMAPEKAQELKAWYFQRYPRTARDRQGVMNYLRSKGHDTSSGISTGEDSAVSALQEQLRREGRARRDSRVHNAIKVSKERVSFSQIRAQSGSLDRVEAKEPTSPDGSESVTGVLVRNNVGGYDLVDGHSRLKFMRDARKRKGNFLIME